MHYRAGWRFDNGFHLNFAIDYTPWQYFFIPEILRLQSGANLTSWNALFYDLNLSLSELGSSKLLSASACNPEVNKHRPPDHDRSLFELTTFLDHCTVLLCSCSTWAIFSLSIDRCIFLSTDRGMQGGVCTPRCHFAIFGPPDRSKHVYCICYLIYWAFWSISPSATLCLEGCSVAIVQIMTTICYRLSILSASYPCCCLAATLLEKRRLSLSYLLTTTAALLFPLIPLIDHPGINAPDRYLYSIWRLVIHTSCMYAVLHF